MSFSGRVFRLLMSLLPRYNRLLFTAACAYRDRYRSENNQDMETNGELQLLNSILPTSKVVFDVGAHFGDWTRIALKANPRAVIHCFEPSAQSFAKILARGFPSNVAANNIALDSAAGSRPLLAMPDACMNSLYRYTGMEAVYGSQQSTTETVACDTIDAYCETHAIECVDFLKVDVEGSEMEVLRGAKVMLQRRAIRTIQFEHTCCAVASRTLLADFFDFLLPFGYSLYKIHPRGLWRLPAYDIRLETFDYANYVAALDLPEAIVKSLPSWRYQGQRTLGVE